MNIITILIGAAALVFGTYTTYIRATDPSRLGKLEAMKQQWGERAGVIVHVVAYTVIPIIFGIVMVLAGIKGMSFFER